MFITNMSVQSRDLNSGEGSQSIRNGRSLERCMPIEGENSEPSQEELQPLDGLKPIQITERNDNIVDPMKEGSILQLVPISSEIANLIRKCVDRILSVFRLYGFDDNGFSTQSTTDHYIYLCSIYGGDWVKMFKDKLASLRASWLDQPLPDFMGPAVVFNPKIILGGKAYRFFRKLYRENPSKFDSFLFSLARVKSGMPRPTEEYLLKASVKTLKSLASVPVKKDEEVIHKYNRKKFNYDLAYLDRAKVLEQVRRTVREVFRGKKFDLREKMEPFFPSSSASYNNTRSELGTLGMLVHELNDSLVGRDLIRSVSCKIPLIDDKLLREEFQTLYSRQLAEARNERPVAEPVALAEALKIRVITKGPPKKYFVLKPLQRFLWRTMKSLRPFHLIGGPLTEDLLENLFPDLPLGESFLSVDYSDATNQISSEATNVALDTLAECIGLSPDEVSLCRQALTEHILTLGKSFGKKTKHPELAQSLRSEFLTFLNGQNEGQQQNGQLMGSILSFPFLCLINLSVIRFVKELDCGKFIKIKNLRACVNGDDGLFTTTPEGKLNWEVIASMVGLNPSVGKVFFSKNFLEINSANFRVIQTQNLHPPTTLNPHGYIEKFQRSSYINFGILTGQQRVVGTRLDLLSGDGHDSLAGKAEELLFHCPEDIREKVYEIFHKNYADVLDIAKRFNIPWYVPRRYGGLGLPELGRFKMTDLDLRLMRKFDSHPEKYKLPITRGSLPTPIWDHVNRRRRELGLTCLANLFSLEFTETPGFIGRETFNGLLAVEGFLTLPKAELEKTITLMKERSDLTKSYFRPLSKFWRHLVSDPSVPLPEPYSRLRIPSPIPTMPEVYIVDNDITDYSGNFLFSRLCNYAT
nr:RNA-dependent RNA polymerase [Flumine narna-like virus 57]